MPAVSDMMRASLYLWNADEGIVQQSTTELSYHSDIHFRLRLSFGFFFP